MSRIAFAPHEVDKPDAPDDFACTAPGCPNRWTSSVDAGYGVGWRKLCRAHGAVPPRLWSLVTDAQLRARADVPSALQREPLDEAAAERAKARLGALREELRARAVGPARAWAHALRERERAGAALRKIQRRAWREVLGEPSAPDEEEEPHA